MQTEAEVACYVSGCIELQKFIADVEALCPGHLKVFWPDGFDRAPDIELASTYGAEVEDFVGGAGSLYLRAQIVPEELERRGRLN